MKIKPIGTLNEGKLELVHNARTQKSSIQYLKKEITEFIENHNVKSIGVAHANVIEFVDKLKKSFSDAFILINLMSTSQPSYFNSHRSRCYWSSCT